MAALIGYMFLAGGRLGGVNQFQQIGSELGQQVSKGRIPQSYKWVGDSQEKLYWPNEPRYVNDIPRSRRVYILDDKTLGEFKGYKPGPR